MIGEQLIDFVVNSYEFTPTRGARVKRIVMRGIDKLGLTDADAQYEYADRIAQTFTASMHGPISLDSKLPQCEYGLYDLIGSIDSKLQALVEDGDGGSHTDDIPFSDVSSFGVCLRNIDDYPEQIRCRLHEVSARYCRDGKIILPQRTIVTVSFDPLSFRFRRRRFNGNPLSFFQEHGDRYKGLSRSELAKFDRGLYDSLIRFGQLDIAVPQNQRLPLSDAERQKIVAAFLVNNGGIKRTAIQSGHAISTIDKYTKRLGLEAQQHGRPLSDDKRKHIISCYGDCAGDAHSAARKIGCSYKTVARYWASAGLKAKGIGGRCLPADQIKEICDAYSTYGGNARSAARGLHYSRGTISKYWKEAYLM
jgi:hypothetical protein